MKQRTILFFICWFASALLSTLGFYGAGLWYGVLIVPCAALIWLFIRDKAPATGLILSTGVNVAGILLGAPALLMILSAGTALAAWDLLSLEQVLAGQKPSRGVRRYQNLRLLALFFALITGLSLLFFGRLVRLHLLFYLVAIIVCLIFFCLERILYHLQKSKARDV